MKRFVIIAVAVLSLTPQAARGQEPPLPEVVPPKARTLAEQGRTAHDAGKYDEAIVSFKEAYVIAPSPGLLFNIAQAYRLQGDCDGAAMMYRRYLETDPGPEGRTIAGGHLATVERCIQQRGLRIAVDSTVGQIKIPPPPLVQVSSSVERRTPIEKTVGIGLTIGGSAALGVALYYGLAARDASSTVEDAYGQGAKWSDIADVDARGERAATLAKAFGIGGGLAVVTGVTLYVLGKRAERNLPVAVAPTKHGAEVTLAWRF